MNFAILISSKHLKTGAMKNFFHVSSISLVFHRLKIRVKTEKGDGKPFNLKKKAYENGRNDLPAAGR